MIRRILGLALLTSLLYGCSPESKVNSLRESVASRAGSSSKGTNTVLVGGHHYITEDDLIFREHILPALAKNGYTHLALEVDRSLQPLAHDLPKLRKAIDDFADPDEVIKTIKHAYGLGFEVHFVDDFGLGHKGPKSLSERNEQIAGNLEATVLSDNPNAKIAAFFGAGHVPIRPFSRPDAGTVLPLGYFLTQMRGQEPYVTAILPHYKVEQFGRYEGKGQTLDVVSLGRDHLLTASSMNQ